MAAAAPHPAQQFAVARNAALMKNAAVAVFFASTKTLSNVAEISVYPVFAQRMEARAPNMAQPNARTVEFADQTTSARSAADASPKTPMIVATEPIVRITGSVCLKAGVQNPEPSNAPAVTYAQKTQYV